MSDTVDKATEQLLSSITKSQDAKEEPANPAKTAKTTTARRATTKKTASAKQSPKAAAKTKPETDESETTVLDSRASFAGKLRWPD